MSLVQSGVIQAVDYNSLVGGNPVTASGKLNTVWSTGGTSAGYGQTAVANVSVGQVIAAAEWNSLIGNTAKAATHQGTSITSISGVVSGGVISASPLTNLPSNLTAIYNSRLNAASQGSTTANTATYGSAWQNAITFTHTITFASGDAARYFFNAGGQLAITCSHPAGTGINLLLNNLASNVGTVVMSSPTSGSVTIAGTSYNGITKVGGGGNAPTVLTNSGYFAQTTSNANVFLQTASTGPSGYLSTFINVLTKSNGTQGSNGDAGSVLTIATVWDEIPNGLSVAVGSSTTVTLRPPETTNIANTWGAVSISGAVSGS